MEKRFSMRLVNEGVAGKMISRVPDVKLVGVDSQEVVIEVKGDQPLESLLKMCEEIVPAQ